MLRRIIARLEFCPRGRDIIEMCRSRNVGVIHVKVGIDNGYRLVNWISVLRARIADIREVLIDVACRVRSGSEKSKLFKQIHYTCGAIVHDPATGKEGQTIEEGEYFPIWLVNGRNADHVRLLG